jgi:hypothetical protein
MISKFHSDFLPAIMSLWKVSLAVVDPDTLGHHEHFRTSLPSSDRLGLISGSCDSASLRPSQRAPAERLCQIVSVTVIITLFLPPFTLRYLLESSCSYFDRAAAIGVPNYMPTEQVLSNSHWTLPCLLLCHVGVCRSALMPSHACYHHRIF